MTYLKRSKSTDSGLTNPFGIVPEGERRLLMELQERVLDIQDKIDSTSVSTVVEYDDTELRRELRQTRYAVDRYIENLWTKGFRPSLEYGQ